MKIEVGELRDLMHMITGEIKKFKDVHTGEITFQEHTMECERSWEEGYDKGYQDAKNELKDEAEKKAISAQKSSEDLTSAIPIDLATETHLNRHFTIPPRNFGHDGLMYKLSNEEDRKACEFVYRLYEKYEEYNRKSELTFSYKTFSSGIGIRISIVCDQYPEEWEDITDYSRW